MVNFRILGMTRADFWKTHPKPPGDTDRITGKRVQIWTSFPEIGPTPEIEILKKIGEFSNALENWYSGKISG